MVQKVAIYCRVSTTDQSCERQERELLEYAALAGYQVVGIWQETAAGTKQNRVERQKVLEIAQARKINAILGTEITRWGRSTIDLIQTLQDLHTWDVSLIATTGIQFDLNTSFGTGTIALWDSRRQSAWAEVRQANRATAESRPISSQGIADAGVRQFLSPNRSSVALE